MAGPLANLKVLDLSRVLAGPWAGQLLADLGAEVIKVERPGTGDDTRGWGPPYLKDRNGGNTGEAAYFLSANRGKRSIAIDISTAAGQNIVRDLAARSDVLIENYKVGGLSRYGLDYGSLSAVNPALIYCSITGFGQTGPYKDRAGYDFMIQAMGGLMSLTGEADDHPGGGPMKTGVAIADLTAGMYAVIAIQAALLHRERIGRGQYIDMALLDVQVGWLANQNMNYLAGGAAPGRRGNAHPNIVPYQAFETADGHIVLAVGNDRQFARFVALAGEDALTDPRFGTNEGRVRHRELLVPLVAEVMRRQTTQAWIADLEAERIPCGPINGLAEVFADPQIQARGLKFELPHPLAGTVPQVKTPIEFSETALDYARPPPLLGEHTDEILEELGLSSDRIAALRSDDVVD